MSIRGCPSTTVLKLSLTPQMDNPAQQHDRNHSSVVLILAVYALPTQDIAGPQAATSWENRCMAKSYRYKFVTTCYYLVAIHRLS